MTPVPQAAVDAVREAIEAHRLCANTCSCGWATDTSPRWVERTAAHAHEEIAAAVVAAAQGPIKAEALREAADERERLWASGGHSVYAMPEWLRARADRLGVQP